MSINGSIDNDPNVSVKQTREWQKWVAENVGNPESLVWQELEKIQKERVANYVPPKEGTTGGSDPDED